MPGVASDVNRADITTSGTICLPPDTVAPTIILNGSDVIDLVRGRDAYVELGATWSDNTDPITGTLLASEIFGTVDTGTRGTYTITYTHADAAGNTGTTTRTVNVVSDSPISGTVTYVPAFVNNTTTTNSDVLATIANFTQDGLAITGITVAG